MIIILSDAIFSARPVFTVFYRRGKNFYSWSYECNMNTVRVYEEVSSIHVFSVIYELVLE